MVTEKSCQLHKFKSTLLLLEVLIIAKEQGKYFVYLCNVLMDMQGGQQCT